MGYTRQGYEKFDFNDAYHNKAENKKKTVLQQVEQTIADVQDDM